MTLEIIWDQVVYVLFYWCVERKQQKKKVLVSLRIVMFSSAIEWPFVNKLKKILTKSENYLNGKNGQVVKVKERY